MEVKWFMLVLIVMVAVAGTAGTVSIYKESRCLEAYAASGRTAEEINLICRGVTSRVTISDRDAK